MSITEPKYKEELVMQKMPMFNVVNDAMEKNIGKQVRFKKPTCLAQEGIHTIKSIQKIYDGSLAYRVYGDGTYGDFGCPARITDIEIINQ